MREGGGRREGEGEGGGRREGWGSVLRRQGRGKVVTPAALMMRLTLVNSKATHVFLS